MLCFGHLFGRTQTVFFGKRSLCPFQEQKVLTKMVKMTNVHSVHENKVLAPQVPEKDENGENGACHACKGPACRKPWFVRPRPLVAILVNSFDVFCHFLPVPILPFLKRLWSGLRSTILNKPLLLRVILQQMELLKLLKDGLIW